MPVPLDEYPVHQVPLSMAYVATSDRNAYDRCYVNAHNRTGELFLVAGMGVYPNLGVTDAFVTVMRNGRQSTLQLSDGLGSDRTSQRVGPFGIEVVEPLRQLRLACEPGELGIGLDLLWTGSFPAVDEPLHTMRSGPRIILEGARFAQVGTCEGTVHLDGEEFSFTTASSAGTRDRSWGIRPVGESEPPGRPAAEPAGGFGFWWTYVPLRFDDFAIVVIAQEDGDGTRTTAEAVRVWPSETGRPAEQLGWADIVVHYRTGTRVPSGATITMTKRGTPTVVEIESLGYVLLNAGPGYNGDPGWSHGRWRGPGSATRVDADLDDPALQGQTAFGVIDHIARASCDGQLGYGLFEHACFGRHAPSSFAGWESVAP
ncbi:MAG: hypothetical protein ACLQNG_10405 [Acidimicrobiales bacterium]|jgi:hypothetical protein